MFACAFRTLMARSSRENLQAVAGFKRREIFHGDFARKNFLSCFRKARAYSPKICYSFQNEKKHLVWCRVLRKLQLWTTAFRDSRVLQRFIWQNLQWIARGYQKRNRSNLRKLQPRRLWAHGFSKEKERSTNIFTCRSIKRTPKKKSRTHRRSASFFFLLFW